MVMNLKTKMLALIIFQLEIKQNALKCFEFCCAKNTKLA